MQKLTRQEWLDSLKAGDGVLVAASVKCASSVSRRGTFAGWYLGQRHHAYVAFQGRKGTQIVEASRLREDEQCRAT